MSYFSFDEVSQLVRSKDMGKNVKTNLKTSSQNKVFNIENDSSKESVQELKEHPQGKQLPKTEFVLLKTDEHDKSGTKTKASTVCENDEKRRLIPFMNSHLDITQAPQGICGDCWLLAGMHSIQLNDPKKLEGLVEIYDGIVKVKIPNTDKTYQLTEDEVKSSKYSTQDPSVTAFEMAMDKYIQDVNNIDPLQPRFSYEIEGGTLDHVASVFYPNKGVYVWRPNSRTSCQDLLSNLFKEGAKNIVEMGMNKHAYTITGYNPDTEEIEYINPWKPKEVIKDKVNELDIAGIQYINLDEDPLDDLKIKYNAASKKLSDIFLKDPQIKQNIEYYNNLRKDYEYIISTDPEVISARKKRDLYFDMIKSILNDDSLPPDGPHFERLKVEQEFSIEKFNHRRDPSYNKITDECHLDRIAKNRFNTSYSELVEKDTKRLEIFDKIAQEKFGLSGNELDSNYNKANKNLSLAEDKAMYRQSKAYAIMKDCYIRIYNTPIKNKKIIFEDINRSFSPSYAVAEWWDQIRSDLSSSIDKNPEIQITKAEYDKARQVDPPPIILFNLLAP